MMFIIKFYLKSALTFFVLLYFSDILFSQQQNKVITVNKDIELIQLKDSFFVHTTWFESEQFGRFASNGLLFIKNGKALIIDTPNSNEQTAELFNFLKDSMHIKLQKVIVCHFHSDCLGGLEFINQQAIESIGNDMTKKICIEKKLPIPSKTFSGKMSFNFEGEKVICQYFGPGHTVDNIVVYFPLHNILFGGCLIKSLSATGLGNTADAVVNQWGFTVEKIQKAYQGLEYVIPGHGDFGDSSLLNHTISLLKSK